MKRILTIGLILMLALSSKNIYAGESNNVSNDGILKQQQEELGISDFIKSSNEYTNDNLEGIDIKELFTSAITGRIGNTNLLNNILNLFGREFKSTISTIRNSTHYHYYS